MTLTMVFLGKLEDVAGCASRVVPLTASLDDAIDALGPELADALRGPRIKLAVNGVLLQGGAAPVLRDGDEIAFLPPVSGG